MRFLKFGNINNKAIILIHGYGISWKMWQKYIDRLKTDYYVIVPILQGHDLDNNTTFTSVQHSASKIADYVLASYGKQVYAICGASLGGTIAIDILVQNKLKVIHAIIDCGPVVKMSKIVLSYGIKTRLKQISKIKKNPQYIKQLLSKTFYSDILINEIIKIGQNMSEQSCKNAHLSVFNYYLPKSFANCKTHIAYWYGSKEWFWGKKYANAILALKPTTNIRVFTGKKHCEMCISNTHLYLQEIKVFLENKY
ncbi:alpha/beta hydrolase [Clostridium sp. 'deep sea']|uniref:alpha/beta fold hydrolase n=1 Tax=Clostridium sp. 'deep sea' TaxID=2779445 RepID=UPI0018969B62|nr:alpha/beta hydrolase [Clostridium sp. 'deep sea']QOR34967.1 alpha/beta hydrolase [Clostridium sp. 'deep sea']